MDMKDIKHPDMVAYLAKPGDAIIESLTPSKAHALHMAVGMAGEAAELMDGVVFSDRDNVVEELGDLEFYVEGLRQGADINRHETLDKLGIVDDSFGGHANSAVGVFVECGNILDVVKKSAIYNKELNRESLVTRLTRFEYYMDNLRNELGITREETITANIAKLGVRYANGYSDKAAHDRADKQVKP